MKEKETINIKENAVRKTTSKFLTMLILLSSTLIVLGLAGGAMLKLLIKINVPVMPAALISSQFAVAVLIPLYFQGNKDEFTKILKQKWQPKYIFTPIKITFLTFFINVVVSTIFKTNGETTSTVDSLVNEVSLSLSIVLPVLMAPVFEELAIRGGLKYLLVDKNKFSKISYVIISSIMFGLLHLSSFDAMGITQVLITGLMGSLFAIAYLKTDCIYVPIMSHAIYNGLIMFISLSL